jgi:AmmeMemoRadiSam system protein B
VAGTWYPGTEAALRAAVEAALGTVSLPPMGEVVGLIAPHAGLVYSGSVAACAYQAAARSAYDVVVLVGPSHHVRFEGVAISDHAAFDTPLGPVPVATDLVGRLLRAPGIRQHPTAHQREHSLEMQLPFLRHLLPATPIVPMLMGSQDGDTVRALATALAEGLADMTPLLVASTDLSHFFEARRAAELDQVVIDRVTRYDADGLLAEYERYPPAERGRYVACGGGTAVAVMKAASALGAREAQVLRHADSGDVTGDKDSVVGYLAAALVRA